MKQLARNLTDDMNGFLNGYRYLLRDWARVFSEEFRMVLQAAGVETVRLPARSPNLNAFAERFVRTRSEEHTSELHARQYLVCRLLLEKKKPHSTMGSL